MTFRLTPQASAALRSGQHPLAPLVEVVLPGHTMFHLVGAGEVRWGNKVFTGNDPLFGTLVAAGTLKDGVGDEAPDWDLTFVPSGDVAAAALASATAQGGEVNGWLAVVNRDTGIIVPDPLQLFAGELDVPRLRVGKATRSVEWRCASALEPFHDQEIGARLSDAWHRLVWPNEEGLANMTGIERTSYWGVEKPPSAVSVVSGSTRASFLSAMGL
jgi:hypothetical protein